MSFLADYALFTSGNEVPRLYHTWAGLSTISHLMGRRVWFDMTVFTAYPNLYVVFVGDAGSRKTTAMRLSQKIIEHFPNIVVAGASETKESFVKMMADDKSGCKKVFDVNGHPIKYSHMSIFANEFVSLIGNRDPVTMTDFLTDVWDRPVYRANTIIRGAEHIVGPYVTMLACMTTDTAKTLVAQRVITGGLARRLIFVLPTKREKPVAFPELTQEQKDAFDRCIAHARMLQGVGGQFQWGPGGKDVFQKFYDANYEKLGSATNAIHAQFLETKPEYVLKVAMLICLSETPEKLELSAEYIQAADALVSEVEYGGVHVFGGTGRNQLSPVASAILRIIELSDTPIRIKTIYAQNLKDASIEEIDKILDEFNKIDKLRVFDVTTNGTVVRMVARMDVYQQIEAARKAALSGKPH